MYKVLEKHCFNLYLLHDPINYVIMAAFARVLLNIDYNTVNWLEVGIALSVMRIVGNIFVCIIISVIIEKVKRIKVGRLLIIVGIICLAIIYYCNNHGIITEMNIYLRVKSLYH